MALHCRGAEVCCGAPGPQRQLLVAMRAARASANWLTASLRMFRGIGIPCVDVKHIQSLRPDVLVKRNIDIAFGRLEHDSLRLTLSRSKSLCLRERFTSELLGRARH